MRLKPQFSPWKPYVKMPVVATVLGSVICPYAAYLLAARGHLEIVPVLLGERVHLGTSYCPRRGGSSLPPIAMASTARGLHRYLLNAGGGMLMGSGMRMLPGEQQHAHMRLAWSPRPNVGGRVGSQYHRTMTA